MQDISLGDALIILNFSDFKPHDSCKNNSYKKTVCILRFSPAPLNNVTESSLFKGFPNLTFVFWLFKGFPNLTFVFYQFLIVEKVVQGKNS